MWSKLLQMHQYLTAGTSFLDGRTKRYRHITRAASALIGSQAYRILPTEGHEDVYNVGDPRKGIIWGRLYPRTRINYLKKPTSTKRRYKYGMANWRRGTPRRRKYYRTRSYNPYRRAGRRKGWQNYRTGGFMHMKGRAAIAEMKFKNYELDQEDFTTSWAAKNPTTVNCISAVAQGDTEQNRDGRVYYMHSINLKGSIHVPAAESSTEPCPNIMFRLCVVLDKQTNGTEVVGTDVMDASQSKDLFGFRNLQHTSRFYVLWDRTFTVAPVVQNEGAVNLFSHSSIQRTFKFFKKFKKPIKVTCTGTTGVVGSISDNSLSVIGIASNIVDVPHISYQARLRFTG